MNPILNFLKKNVIAVILGIVVIVLAILYFGSGNKTTVTEEVESADAPATLLQSAPGQAATAPAGAVLFCIRVDGRGDGHLPALIGGGPNSYPNGYPGGYNWGLMPNATGDEDYGVMADGTVFVKLKFLTNHMNSFAEYIGEPGWIPVKMTEEKVNGEPALVYRIPNF